MNKEFLNGYIECALWSSTNDDEDTPFELMCISTETLETMKNDCANFLETSKELIIQNGISMSQAGHDFWLTRNGHGAGFWDRGLGEIGVILTERCKPYGTCGLYLGDDGLIYHHN